MIGKIDNVAAKVNLPAEMRCGRGQTMPQMPPEFAFRERGLRPHGPSTHLVERNDITVSQCPSATFPRRAPLDHCATSRPPPLPLPTRGRGFLQRFMTAVAHRLMLRALAGAEPDFLARSRLPFLRTEFGALMRAVAERLRFRAPAGAPPIAFAGHDIDRAADAARRFQGRSCCVSAPFSFLPPPSVASHALPQAIASSRTRKM